MDQPPLRAVFTRPEVEVYTLRCKGYLEGIWTLRAKTRQVAIVHPFTSRHALADGARLPDAYVWTLISAQPDGRWTID